MGLTVNYHRINGATDIVDGRMERRLATVLISDVVGYTNLMEEDTE